MGTVYCLLTADEQVSCTKGIIPMIKPPDYLAWQDQKTMPDMRSDD